MRKLGNDYHLWIDNGAGVFNRIKGQTTLSVTRNGPPIDISAKEDYPYSAQASGMRTLTIAVDILPDLPDPTGYSRLETVAMAVTETPTNFQIRKNGVNGTGADVVLQGAFNITDFNTDFGQNSPAKVAATLVAASAPTTDLLA